MRWSSKPKPEIGDCRVKVAFLWLPKKINNEWRWMEWAAWEEQYDEYKGSWWLATRWLEGEIKHPDWYEENYR